MDLIDTFNIAGSGLSAQRARLQTITSNLANARTTSTEDGGPYKRRAPVFVAETVDPFGDSLDRALSTVRVDRIEESDSPGRVVYDQHTLTPMRTKRHLPRRRCPLGNGRSHDHRAQLRGQHQRARRPA